MATSEESCLDSLTDIVCTELIQEVSPSPDTKAKLVIIGRDNTHIDINQRDVKINKDMATSHEEANSILVQHMVLVAKKKPVGIAVSSDDNDLFFLLHHDLTSAVIMESLVQERTVINIQAIAEQHWNIVPGLLNIHAHSGCDTVASYSGFSKSTVLKSLQAGYPLLFAG